MFLFKKSMNNKNVFFSGVLKVKILNDVYF